MYYLSIIIFLFKMSFKVSLMRFKRIRDLREDKDLYQKDIALILGISQQYYSEYENGNYTIPVEHLIKLARFYNTSVDYILGLTDNKDPYKKRGNDSSFILPLIF